MADCVRPRVTGFCGRGPFAEPLILTESPHSEVCGVRNRCMIDPMLRATLLVIVSACALNAQVTFDWILRADKEPQNWLTYSGNTSSQRLISAS